ncbi:potassium channel family protein [Nocardioides sp. CCNWLW239]|uniref:potassium channel family protein n=1 Tax=Nocardioides sp. CCNWLW239 TaxID=3128902 RepID=UPI003016E006
MRSERVGLLVGVVVLLVAFYFVVPVSADPRGGMVLRVGGSVVAVCLLAVVLGRQLVRHARDLDRHVDGLVASIVLVLVLFALAYYALQLHSPGQMEGVRTRLDALYFSAATMLTIGYGDAHPAGQAARGLALVQMVFDVVYVAAAVRLLSARVGSKAESMTRSSGTESAGGEVPR